MSEHWDSRKAVRGRLARRGAMWDSSRRRSARRGFSVRHAATLRPFVLLWIFAGTAGALSGLGFFDGARGPPVAVAAGSGVAAIAGSATGDFSSASTPSIRADFSLCHTGGGYNCVVDGDTIWLHATNIRLADIDAPETHEARCPAEQERGDRATLRLQQILNGGEVTLAAIDRDADRYGRKLRVVEVGGASVGDTLVGEGLARWYAGGRRSWC